MDNERRGFGRLELIFIFLALAYIGYVVYHNQEQRDNADESVVAILEQTATPRPIQSATPMPENALDMQRLSELQTRTPDTVALYLERATLYGEAGDAGAAIADYNEAVRMDGLNAKAYLDRATYYLELGLYDDALRDVQNAQEYAPNNPQVFIQRADIYAAQDKTDSAIDNYNLALEINASLADAYFGRGKVRYGLEQYDLARADFLEAKDRDPDNADILYYLGKAYEQYSEVDVNARNYYEQALELRPDFVAVRVELGTMYSDLAMYDEALEQFTEAIRLDPTNDVAFNNRGFAYDRMGEYRRAVADYTIAIAYDPTDPVSYLNRGSTYYDIDEYQRSVDDLTFVIENDPENHVAYNNRALSLEQLGDIDGALADYAVSISLQPVEETGLEHYNRGILYYRQEMYREAEGDLLRAATYLPDDPDVFLALGDLYDQLGNLELAVDNYNRHIQLAGNDARSRAAQFVDTYSIPPTPIATLEPSATKSEGD